MKLNMYFLFYIEISIETSNFQWKSMDIDHCPSFQNWKEHLQGTEEQQRNNWSKYLHNEQTKLCRVIDERH